MAILRLVGSLASVPLLGTGHFGRRMSARPPLAPLAWSSGAEANLKRMGEVTSFFPEIDQSTRLFETSERLFNTLLVDDSTASHGEVKLLDRRNVELVKRVGRKKEIEVGIVGPNNTGKSSLVNTMTGARLMPAGQGHVTGRACRISYSSSEESYVGEITLDQYERGEFKPQDATPLHGVPDDQIIRIVGERLNRDKIPSGVSIKDWVRKIVVVSLPLPLLEPGLVLVDLPGTSDSDEVEVQNFLAQFLSVMRPPGLMMVYCNDSFSDAELKCYKFFSQALPRGDADQDPEICFVKTKFDLNSLAYDANLGGNLNSNIWKAQVRRSFEMLKERALPLAQLGPSYEASPNFVCVSAMDASKTRLKANPTATEIWHEYCDRITSWFLRLQTTRYTITFATISEACRNFYHIMHSLSSGRTDKILKEMQEGIAALSSFSQQFETQVLDVASQLPAMLSQKVKERDLVDYFVNKAQTTPLPGLDGATRTGNEKEALGALKLAMEGDIQSRLLDPVLDELKNKMQLVVQDCIKNLLSAVQENRLLENAISNVIRVADIPSSLYLHTGIYSKMVNSFTGKLMGRGYLSGVLLTISAPILGAMFLGAGIVAAIDAVSGLFTTIDSKWKSNSMKHILSEIPKLSTPQALQTGVNDAIQQVSDRIRQEMRARTDAANVATIKFKLAQLQLPELRLNFSKLEAMCWAAEMKMTGSTQAPKFETDRLGSPLLLNQGGTGSVYAGTWNNEKVVLKVPRSTSANILLSFFEEVHYSREVSTSTSPHLLRASGIWQDPVDGTWMLIYPRCKGTLRELLVEYIDSGRTFPTILGLNFLLQVAKGLASMHEIGVMHRDVKFDNVLYNELPDGSYHILLADFGTCTNNLNPTTNIGTPFYIAPEVDQDEGKAYTLAADVYSFGVMVHCIFSELAQIAAHAGPHQDHWLTLFNTQLESAELRPSMAETLNALEILHHRLLQENV